jgi:hypothetical protein
MGWQYVLYFLFGGLLVSGVTYLANQSRSLLAAFIATLPVMTTSTFILIYFTTGQEAVLSYAKGLVVMVFPWLVFILAVIVLSPRIGFIVSLVAGLCLQIVAALVIFALSGRFFPRF